MASRGIFIACSNQERGLYDVPLGIEFYMKKVIGCFPSVLDIETQDNSSLPMRTCTCL